MELQLERSHNWERRWPDWRAAAVAGFAAGAVLMVFELIWEATMGASGPWRVPHMIAALVLGPDILKPAVLEFNLGVMTIALTTHYVLGVVFGLLLGLLIAGFHYETSLFAILWIGAGFGFVLYLFNFHLLSAFVPWFADLRGWGTLFAHMAFGTVAAGLYWKLARPSDEGS